MRMWEQIMPVVVQVLTLVIPALGVLILAIITRTTQKWVAAKSAASSVENSPLSHQHALSSEQKLQLAVDQMTDPGTPLMARMNEREAARLVEILVPLVSRLSDASQLRPPSGAPLNAPVSARAHSPSSAPLEITVKTSLPPHPPPRDLPPRSSRR